MRKRLQRYTLSDRGRAIEKSGKPPGWREAAERAVEPMNVDRQGTVFVPTVAGPHLSRFIELLADASRAVHEAVIVLVDRRLGEWRSSPGRQALLANDARERPRGSEVADGRLDGTAEALPLRAGGEAPAAARGTGGE